MKVFAWLASIFAAVAGFFSIKKRIESRVIAKQQRQLNKAIKVVERQLKKTDDELDQKAREKIETIRKATTEILAKRPTGKDANALVKKIRGTNR